MSVVEPLTTAILTVLSIAVVGYLLGTLRDVDVGPLATVTMYVLAPALVFHSLTTTDLDGGAVAGIVASVVLFTLLMVGLSEGVGRAIGETGTSRRRSSPRPWRACPRSRFSSCCWRPVSWADRRSVGADSQGVGSVVRSGGV